MAAGIEWIFSRLHFHALVSSAGLIVSDFSTSAAHLSRASSREELLSHQQRTTVLSMGLSFSHLTSGLPFDFSLESGLVSVHAASPGRLLAQQEGGEQTRWFSDSRIWVDRRQQHKKERKEKKSSLLAKKWHAGRAQRGSSDRPVRMPPRPPPSGSESRGEGAYDPTSREGNHSLSAWSEQIRFAPQPRRAAGRVTSLAKRPLSTTREVEVADVNGGDDFTFTFPQSDRLYRVYGFGFDILDNVVTSNESFSIYDENAFLIGRLDLSNLSVSSPNTGMFLGFLSKVPIGFASFDEGEDSDRIGIARFVFGYRELEAPPYSPSAWASFGVLVSALLLLEARTLHRMQPSLGLALLWLLALVLIELLVLLFVWLAWSWRKAKILAFACALNSLLSADNLFVFMIFLQQLGLRRDHLVIAICHGFMLAACARVLLVLMGSALLQRFSSLLLGFAAFLFVVGFNMLCSKPSPSSSIDSAAGSQRWVIRCIGWMIPLSLDDLAEPVYFVYDESGRLCATRMAVSVVGICLSDVLFALDSIPAVLSLTTSPFILVSSQAMSLLQLRAIYFLIERVAAQIESMQHVLAVVLILIAAKIILEAAGVVVPITTFVAILVAWRVLASLLGLAMPWMIRVLFERSDAKPPYITTSSVSANFEVEQ